MYTVKAIHYTHINPNHCIVVSQVDCKSVDLNMTIDFIRIDAQEYANENVTNDNVAVEVYRHSDGCPVLEYVFKV